MTFTDNEILHYYDKKGQERVDSVILCVIILCQLYSTAFRQQSWKKKRSPHKIFGLFPYRLDFLQRSA